LHTLVALQKRRDLQEGCVRWLKSLRPAPAHEADLRLAERCRAGEREARGELFRRYAPELFPLLRRLSRSEADAEDLLQQAFMAALKGIERYRGDAPLLSWLRVIAVRTAYRQFRRPALFLPLEDADEPSSDPRRRIESRAALRALELHLEKLPENQRLAFLLYEVEGYTLPEIATLLEISLTAAKKRVFRGIHELKRLVADDPQLAEYFGRRKEGRDG
jgi:RNA polymerase sigma-70 factor, ECF subfamily